MVGVDGRARATVGVRVGADGTVGAAGARVGVDGRAGVGVDGRAGVGVNGRVVV